VRPCRRQTPPSPPCRPPSAWRGRARALPPLSSAWRYPHQTPTSPPLFSLDAAQPQKGIDAPAIPFSCEHLIEDPNPPRLLTSLLSRFPIAGTLHSAPDFPPSRAADRLPDESSPRAPCASHQWAPHPFPHPLSCRSVPQPSATTVWSSPPLDAAEPRFLHRLHVAPPRLRGARTRGADRASSS
jgi:hypothetical protein